MIPINARIRAATLLLVLLQPAGAAYGFACFHGPNGACVHWSQGSVTLRTLLGNPTGELMNGTLSWDTNVLNAADEWNSAGAAFQYTVVQDDNGSPNFTCPGSGQCGGAPGDNPIFFSSTACSGGFGDIVAVTVTCWDDTGAIVDAPVLFNSTVPWNAYDGALQPPLNDIHRVLLHEFGHVFGLAHPDQATPPQIVVAIMNSHESDTYQLQPDDISGIQTIYRNNAAPTTGCQIDAPNGARATWLLVVPAVIALRRRARAC